MKVKGLRSRGNVALAMPAKPKQRDEDRFAERVTRLPNGCWAWDNDLTTHGRFYPNKDRRGESVAYRWAYTILVGPIPDGHDLHHTCEHPGCVNPAHLVPLTHSDHRAEHHRLRREA